MTELEREKMMSAIDHDLRAIEENEEYLLKKFRKLSDRGKEDVVTQLNISLNSDSKQSETKEVKNVIRKFAVMDGIDIDVKCRLLERCHFEEITEYIEELYKSEPKRRGGQPRYYKPMYERLSLFSKRKVIDRINKFLNPTLEYTSKCAVSNQESTGTAKLIDLSSRTLKGKGDTV